MWRGAGSGHRSAWLDGAGRAREDETLAILDYWGATLSHRAAASLWQLPPPEDGPVDVSIRGSGGRARRAGIRLHRSLTLLAGDVTLRRGIPVTTAARTLGDQAMFGRTRSDLEDDFGSLCRRYRLPEPEVNVRVGPHLVDFLWREPRLVAEVVARALRVGADAA